MVDAANAEDVDTAAAGLSNLNLNNTRAAACRYFIIGGDCKNKEQLELKMMQLRSFEVANKNCYYCNILLLHLITTLSYSLVILCNHNTVKD